MTKLHENAGRWLLTGSLAALTVFICMQRYADYDLWWHMKLGEFFLSHFAFPSVDTFSYPAAGQPQFTGEWLADSLIYLIYTHGGYLGLNLFKAAMLLTAFFLLYLRMRDLAAERGVNLAAAILTLLLVLFSFRFHLFARPYLFSLPMLAGFLYLLGDPQRYGSRRLFVLPLLMLVWINLSVGAIFGLIVVFAALAADLFHQRSWRLLPVAALTALAALINPEGLRYFAYVFTWATDPGNTATGENQPLSIDLLWGSGFWYTIWFQILVGASAIGFLWHRGWKNLFTLGLFVFFLFEAFRHIRLVDLFALVAAPYLYLLLVSVGDGLGRLTPARLSAQLPRLAAWKTPILHGALTIFIVSLIPIAVLNSRVYTFGVGLKASAFPEEAIRFLDRNRIDGRMFNNYGFGGYLIWRGGGRKVFIDGRYPRIYTPQQFDEYKQMLESAEAWAAGESKYGFDYAILEYDVQTQKFPQHLLANPHWAIVYWDNQSVVLVKRLPKWEGLIAANEYRVARPRYFDFAYLDQYIAFGQGRTIAAMLDREVALNPDNQFVALARIYVLFNLGPANYGLIRSELERIRSIPPDFAVKHSALAIILAATGQRDAAREEALTALALDPRDVGALSLANELGIEIKRTSGGVPGHP